MKKNSELKSNLMTAAGDNAFLISVAKHLLGVGMEMFLEWYKTAAAYSSDEYDILRHNMVLKNPHLSSQAVRSRCSNLIWLVERPERTSATLDFIADNTVRLDPYYRDLAEDDIYGELLAETTCNQ